MVADQIDRGDKSERHDQRRESAWTGHSAGKNGDAERNEIVVVTPIDKAVLLAAGRGTRMRELTADLPKPMIEVRGKPVLQHIVEGLRDAGVRRLIIIVGYHGDAVQNFFGDGQRHNVDIEYVTQTVQD